MKQMECQNCKELDAAVVNTYHEVDEIGRAIAWDEIECPNCKAYSQMSRVDPDYDPTPDEEGEPPITMAERALMAGTGR